MPADGLHPVVEPDEPGPPIRVGAPGPVVPDGEPDRGVRGLDLDLDNRRVGVLGRVGERLGGDIVSRDFDALGQAPVEVQVELDRHGRAAGERLEGRPEAAPGEDSRMDPPRDLLEVFGRLAQSLGDPRQLSVELLGSRGHHGLGGAELEPERDQALLRAVMEVPLDPATRLVAGRDHVARDALISARPASRERPIVLNDRSNAPISPMPVSGIRTARSPPARSPAMADARRTGPRSPAPGTPRRPR